MDLGIAGKNALICASSKGLGKACAAALAVEGVNVIINSRNESTLVETANELKEFATGSVSWVVADVSSEQGRLELIDACSQIDILVNNAGGPPPGNFRDFSLQDWEAALMQNMLSPIELIRMVVDQMCARHFGRIINITSSAVKAPIATLALSNGARSGLTGFVAGLAREVIADGVTVNNILPGPFDTERMRSNVAFIAANQGADFNEVLAQRQLANPAKRFGNPQEFGHLCAFLCSEGAAYITGQNLVIDGGAYPGTL